MGVQLTYLGTGVGFVLLPFSAASSAIQPSDPKRPPRPRRTTYLISNTYGRPCAAPVAIRSVGHGFPTYDAKLPFLLNDIYDTQKPENKAGVCYRNAATR